jgi:hypothetical protein
MMDKNLLSSKVVGVRLPNGKIQVIKNYFGVSGEIFESEKEFYSKFQHINESDGESVTILESING